MAPRRHSTVPCCRSAVPPAAISSTPLSPPRHTAPARSAAASPYSPQPCGRHLALLSPRHIPPLVAPLRITASPAPIPRPGDRIDLDGVLFSPVLQGATTKATHRAVRRGPRALRRRALAGFAAISDEMIHILVQSSFSNKECFRLHESSCSFILTRLYKSASLNS
jgi:hypothetical protein